MGERGKLPVPVIDAETPGDGGLGEDWSPRGTHVVHFANPDTARLILLPELLGLREAGMRVSVLTGQSPRAEEVGQCGLPVKAIPFTRRMAPLHDLRALIEAVRYLRKVKPTILHTHNPKPNLIGTLAAPLAGVPITVNTVHGRYVRTKMPLLMRWAMAVFERLELRMANRVLAVNEEDAASFRRYGGEEEKVVSLGGGVDLERFDPGRFSATDIRRLRREMGIPPGDLVVGTVGRLVREKGYLELFEALHTVVRHIPHLTLLVVGMADPEKSDALAPEVVRQYAIQDSVVFAGPEATPDLYAVMDVFVLASHREGLPRTPMEAAAMAKPLVLTDIRGCREMVQHGRDGLLVPSREPSALAQALLLLLTDGALRARLGQAARKRALREFDYRRVVATTLQVYQAELQKRNTVPPQPAAPGSPN